jgi:hypothetical protein
MASNTNISLIAKAAKALMRWRKSGFKIVDAGTLVRRENACLACPNLQDTESVVRYIIAYSSQNEKPGQRTGQKVCALCGCYAAKKMLLPTEACPATDPANPALTRWGEPVQ